MKTKIYNLIILDESGSMQAIRSAAVSGVNETLQSIRQAQLKHPDQEHFVTLVTFKGLPAELSLNTIMDCIPVENAKEIEDTDYVPDSCTPLFDAMGFSLNNLAAVVQKDDKVLVTIITDGYENSSVEWADESAIKTLVTLLKNKGWVFAYIGANQDVHKVASSMSIKNACCFTASNIGIGQMVNRLNNARTAMYDRIAEDTFCADKENENFFD